VLLAADRKWHHYCLSSGALLLYRPYQNIGV
jgi:hypothetical protein